MSMAHCMKGYGDVMEEFLVISGNDQQQEWTNQILVCIRKR